MPLYSLKISHQLKHISHLLFTVCMLLSWPATSANEVVDQTESIANKKQDVQDTIHLTMHTSAGDISIELYAKQAPVTTANFIRYVMAGGFNHGEIYRVVREDNDNGAPKITVIQGGANPDFNDFPPIALETTKDTGILHKDGTISMARGEPNTATSAFFICVGDQPALDFGNFRNPDGQGFGAFGRVIQGMGIVRNISAMRDTKEVEDSYMQGQILREPVKINNITQP
ncbi:peptidylprolyl isomerase [Alteromonadaceae bacterium BrNp21-10]|nr:peptidylprolyl isomerase [Alteromonadaceae bacterium BrNp21-10]